MNGWDATTIGCISVNEGNGYPEGFASHLSNLFSMKFCSDFLKQLLFSIRELDALWVQHDRTESPDDHAANLLLKC